jgi:hypothetical protein
MPTRRRIPRLTWALLAALLVAVVVGSRMQGQPDGGKAKGDLPEGLRHVPADAMAFVHVRVGDLLASELGKSLKQRLFKDKEAAKKLQEIEKLTGVMCENIESVTLIFLEPPFMGGRMTDRPTTGFGTMPGQPVPFDAPRTPFDRKDSETKPASPDFPKGFEKEGKGVPKLDPPKDDGDFESPVVFQDDRWMMQEADRTSFGPLMVVTTSQPYDRKKLLKGMLMPQSDDGRGGHRHWAHDVSVLLLSERSFLLGMPAALVRYAEHQTRDTRLATGFKKGGKGGDKGGFGIQKGLSPPAAAPLAAALELGRTPHMVVAGAHIPATLKQMMLAGAGRELPPPAATLYPLLGVGAAGLTLDLGNTADLKIELQGGNARGTALAAEAAKAGLALLDLGFEHMIAMDKADAGDDPKAKEGIELLKKARKALAAATVEQDGAVVRISLRTDLDPTTIAQAVGNLVWRVQRAGDSTIRQNNLKQIALAMHNYHDTYRGLPPPGITSLKRMDGKPLLSWRVAILPWIEQGPLYNEFNLDEPWDSPHNKKLIEKMPPIYAIPGVKTKEPGRTHYQVFAGPGTPFEPRRAQGMAGVRFAEITDGTSNTLMVVEAADPVIWTKPDDLPFDAKAPLPKLGVFGDGFYAALCDGSTRFFRRGIPEQTLRALITRSGGEVIPDW